MDRAFNEHGLSQYKIDGPWQSLQPSRTGNGCVVRVWFKVAPPNKNLIDTIKDMIHTKATNTIEKPFVVETSIGAKDMGFQLMVELRDLDPDSDGARNLLSQSEIMKHYVLPVYETLAPLKNLLSP